ncbi:palmitoyltransferase ZDHHC6 isoform X2 [Bacillus rossius redtenbacheri]|uniref:palmitoyltransferase ZDHHC6 isoform X2 n=1 Tax=Bacillus rossius redtenbacheri TaxID=93214 RepID=UPI002FDD953D
MSLGPDYCFGDHQGDHVRGRALLQHVVAAGRLGRRVPAPVRVPPVQRPHPLPLPECHEVTEHCEFLQFCNTCEGFKAPRTHHCRKCGRCVQKMDHHCPWINNCVGHRNHAHFTAFLFFAVCGCLQATVVLGCSLYRALNRVWYLYYGTGAEPMVYLSVWMLVLCVFSLGLAIGVVLAVGMLLVIQLRGIHRNRTAVEDWIVEKARARRGAADPPFVHPYDLGWRDNCRQVLSCSCDPRGDGLSWPVRDGCDQFTITREQKQQKLEKRQRTRVYTVHTPFSGAWFPVSHGWQVLCHPPFTDESRIRLRRGDTIHVTRWRRHWLFGEKVAPGTEDGSDSASRVRGWFPRACVCEVMDGTADSADKKVN